MSDLGAKEASDTEPQQPGSAAATTFVASQVISEPAPSAAQPENDEGDEVLQKALNEHEQEQALMVLQLKQLEQKRTLLQLQYLQLQQLQELYRLRDEYERMEVLRQTHEEGEDGEYEEEGEDEEGENEEDHADQKEGKDSAPKSTLSEKSALLSSLAEAVMSYGNATQIEGELPDSSKDTSSARTEPLSKAEYEESVDKSVSDSNVKENLQDGNDQQEGEEEADDDDDDDDEEDEDEELLEIQLLTESLRKRAAEMQSSAQEVQRLRQQLENELAELQDECERLEEVHILEATKQQLILQSEQRTAAAEASASASASASSSALSPLALLQSRLGLIAQTTGDDEGDDDYDEEEDGDYEYEEGEEEEDYDDDGEDQGEDEEDYDSEEERRLIAKRDELLLQLEEMNKKFSLLMQEAPATSDDAPPPS